MGGHSIQEGALTGYCDLNPLNNLQEIMTKSYK